MFLNLRDIATQDREAWDKATSLYIPPTSGGNDREMRLDWSYELDTADSVSRR